MSGGADAQVIAGAILEELIGRGVRDIVVCPGSRSQALALAAAKASELGLLRLHVRLDERSAAFFALGVARETGLPAPVIVTSGTAVANLLPAVQEAHYARVPMIILTADRPKSMRGTRANQTVHSTSFTEEFVRYRLELDAGEQESIARETVRTAFDSATGKAAGPSHLNIAFDAPLSGDLEALFGAQTGQNEGGSKDSSAGKHDPSAGAASYVHRNDAPLAVVIAGAGAGPLAEEFAHKAGLPLLAEPSSGARFGREAIQYWEDLLAEEELASRIELAIVFGHPTLTRAVPALIERVPKTVVIDEAYGSEPKLEIYNPGHKVQDFAAGAEVAADFDLRLKRSWLGEWVVRDRELRAANTSVHEPDLEAAKAQGYKERSAYARAEVARLREPISREHLTETLWLATWPHDRLVVAASRLIRVLNRSAAPRNINVHANRGLAGIDGTIATALGIASASQAKPDLRQAAGTTRLLIGDLAFFHDASSLSLPDAADELIPRIQIIVGNDSGGTIFDLLEVAATSDPAMFARVMRTPQRVNIGDLAKAYGWSYRLISNQGELESLFTEPVDEPEIVEVKIAG